MVMVSAAVGRDLYLSVGNTIHHCRLFACHVGRTSRGRKGDAQGAGRRIRNAIPNDVAELGLFHSGGLSSREGLAALIQDRQAGDKDSAVGTDDKRLFIVESEFANVLSQGSREGNTLSACLRDGWDGNDIKPLVKNAPTHCTGPHLAILGNITPSELCAMMTAKDVSNGYLNRFMFIFAERTGFTAIPDRMPDEVVEEFARRTLDSVKWACGLYPAAQNTRRMTLTEQARTLYTAVYPTLCAGDAPERVATLLERAAPYTLRLAMLFAIMDQTLAIEEKHLKAALASVAYWTESVNYVFATAGEQRTYRQSSNNADKLLAWLAGRAERCATRTSIHKDCFSGHLSATKLDELLRSLAADGKVFVRQDRNLQKEGKKPTFVSLPC